jgi:hypothetical protein
VKVKRVTDYGLGVYSYCCWALNRELYLCNRKKQLLFGGGRPEQKAIK